MLKPINIHNPLDNENGIALISSLLITLLLTLVIIALAYRVQLFSIGTRENVVKSQNTYTADIGLNQMRYLLSDKEFANLSTSTPSSPKWYTYKDSTVTVLTNKFTDVTAQISKTFTAAQTFTVAGQSFSYQPSASMTTASGESYSYKVYAKLNSMQIANIVVVAETPGNPAKTVVDAGLIYSSTGGSPGGPGGAGGGGSYGQKGNDAATSGGGKSVGALGTATIF